MLPIVSIVVLNWNGKRFIKPFIGSVLNQSYPKEKLELIFVDNNSSDNSVEHFLSTINKHNIDFILVENDNNYGYAGGNNRGIYKAKGDYILVCNNDIELDKDAITELISVAEKKYSAVTVPKLMYLNKTGVINNAGSEIIENSSWPIIERGANEVDDGQYDKITEVSAFCGACALFRRDFLENVGLFDNKFFLYFEDGDLSWRGQKAGYQYYYAPRAVARHHHTGTSTEGSPLFNFYVGRNRLLILAKNGSFLSYIKAWVATLRQQLLSKLKMLAKALMKRQNIGASFSNIILGLKIIISALVLTPYMWLKRFGIIKEEHL